MAKTGSRPTANVLLIMDVRRTADRSRLGQSGSKQLNRVTPLLLSTHADRQGVDISVTVCVFVFLYGYGFLRQE